MKYNAPAQDPTILHSMPPITRRRFLYGAGTALAGILATESFLIEPDSLEFTEHVITPAERNTGRSIRFAQLSDLHVTGLARLHVEMAERLAAANLDFLIITGDAIDARHHIGDLADVLALLDPKLPKYAIPGNWEHWGRVDFDHLADLYALHGGTLLVNRTATFRAGGIRMNITGLDDSIGGRPSIEHALKGVEPADHHIVLAHCPVQRDYLADYTVMAAEFTGRSMPPVDLDRYRISTLFSGHTHGGQASLLGWRPYLPAGSGPYVKGWYRDRHPHLYVSRGIGTSVVRARLGSIPEVPVFTMMV